MVDDLVEADPSYPSSETKTGTQAPWPPKVNPSRAKVARPSARHMLVGSRPSRTTLSHRLQSLLGAPCWLLNRSQGPLPTCI